MAKITARCPVCEGRITENGGYYFCDSHGIMPYDWVVGNIGRDKALDMMEKWGLEIKRPKREKVVRTRESDDTPAPAPVKGDVTSLLNQLKLAMNPVDKRKLRAALRKAGHTGGLKK